MHIKGLGCRILFVILRSSSFRGSLNRGCTLVEKNMSCAHTVGLHLIHLP